VVVQLGLAPESGPPLSQLLACDTPLRIVALADDRRQLERLGEGLESSDYVMRPYSVRELVARVRAALRHVGGTDDQLLRLGDLVIDRRHRTLTVRGEPVALTATELALLTHLGGSAGQVLTREQLLTALHRPVGRSRYERAIDAHVKNIRRKIEPDPRRPRYLLTAHGAGYQLAED
jgi:DNA-binding response OmpR family regulator